ncbi:family 1 glycosylhydrolase [Gordonia sp. (in: high G+C Gram-positive bacteria)]|uniref:family 1 glycosylhydrolase n=1 Tax=Gordonia sp. (in: high G+C Gram-positive bacteria) TaxID=84139 RepID=UPI0016A15304|nr:family 1 glycosylhydrolase [Gordonia sp. (in: high G+C Gram-positive bacteria)]NLG45605.1 glycoside hydrolase family 1 protein [Gordonia sp. (in: high G+C Gram-positive bacteria)]
MLGAWADRRCAASRTFGVAGIVFSVCILLVTLFAGPVEAKPRSILPADFLWGVASSGFQSEGSSPDSNWTRYIKAGKTDDDIGTSVDFRNRYPDDIARAKALGTKVYRIGIEWARIEKQPGQLDARELNYYDAVVKTIVAAGMRPMITLDHWVYPGWIASRGGWADAGTLRSWLDYNRLIVDRYAKYHPLWITINEPSAYVMKEVQFGGLDASDATLMFDRLVQAHRAIYKHIHRKDPGAQVSSNVAYIPTIEPALDQLFLDRVRDRLDYVGLDYYYSIAPTDLTAAYAATGEFWKASVAADGLFYALRDMGRRFPGKPLYIVEAGMATKNGQPRSDGYRRAAHLRDLVYWMQKARQSGVPVMGMNYWSLTDNYEWGSYTPRFGLYTVDVKTDPTLARRPTPAVAALTKIIADNGVSRSYRPSRPAAWCSLAAAPASCLEPAPRP